MKSADTGVATARSETVSWRRWTLSSLPIMARAAVVCSAGCKDVDGHPLPPIPELSDIMTLIHCYHSFRWPIKGMDENIRHRLRPQFATQMEAVIIRLRERGLDLLWRLLWEKSPDGKRELVVALALRWLKPHMPRGAAPDERRGSSI